MAEKKYNLNSVWFHGVKNEDRQRRADLVLSGHIVLDLLEVIVTSKLAELEQTSLKDYETPNWAFKEADRHGQVRSYKQMLEILKRTPTNG
jgi:hypothetical protein